MALCMASCQSVREIQTIRTEYVDRWHTDSVYIHDTDSIFIKQEQRHDTIIQTVEKWKVSTKIKLVRDTVSVIKTDTIRSTEVVEVEKKLSWTQQAYIGFGKAFLLICLVGASILVYGIIRK